MKQIDRIRSMNAEEIREWLDTNCNYCFGHIMGGKDCPLIEFCFNKDENKSCSDLIMAWLESEVEEE